MEPTHPPGEDPPPRQEIDLQGLRAELERRGGSLVRFHHWDPYILGEHAELRSELIPAADVARCEAARWRLGRFPTIQLCVADAVFSKQREYLTTATTCIRPFAERYGAMSLSKFCSCSWEEVFSETLGRPPTLRGKLYHLSNEGRVLSIVHGSKALLRSGINTPGQARKLGQAKVRCALENVKGIGPALRANVLMNLGLLTVKADTHVIRVLAPFLNIPATASPATYEEALREAAPRIGMEPFVVDQIVWYTESVSGRRSERNRRRA